MNDLKEQLTRARVEDEDGAVDGLRRQVALKRLVNRDAVYVCVVYEPGDENIGYREGNFGRKIFLYTHFVDLANDFVTS